METKITTEKIVNKMKLLRGLSVVFFLVGIYQLFTEDFNVAEDSVNILSIFQTILMLIGGVVMFITSSLTLKKMAGLHIRIYPNSTATGIFIDYKTKKAEAKSILFGDSDSINIKINSIEFNDNENQQHKIDLSDFTSFEDRKRVKNAIEKIKENTMPNKELRQTLN